MSRSSESYHNITYRILSVMVAVCLCILPLSACGVKSIEDEYALSEENKLVIYTAHKEEIYKPIVKEFEERTGIWVELVAGGTNQMLEQIAFEEGVESADIMFGGGVDSLSAYESYFQPYVTAQEKNLDLTYASKTDSYTVFSKLPIVFVYNTKLVLNAGAPRTWSQLLEYRWDNEIAFADPEKSGSSYTALSVMVQQLANEGFNQDDAVDGFVKSLGGELSAGSDTVVDDVASGDKMIGITLEENVLKGKAKSADIEMIYPISGTCAVPDGCAIVKGARHQKNAEKFMEFIVSDDVQHLLEEELFRRSVRTDFESSDIPGEIPYDFEYSNAHRDEILSIWADSMLKVGQGK